MRRLEAQPPTGLTIRRGAFSSINHLFAAQVEQVRPPERKTVAESSEELVELNNPGAYIGPYRNATVPYMVEPMEVLTSSDFEACALCGPAQCGKTQSLIINWIAHAAVLEPLDMIVYSPTQAAARDFSIRRIDRLHRDSRKVRDELLPQKDRNNVHDKSYKNGMLLTLSWPTSAEMRGKPIPWQAITDYDGIDDDIEGEGNAFDLASKRGETFQSFRMILAESSPSKPLENPKWQRTSPHEAPPCKGILGLYNRGDRRRWYWPCPNCNVFFEGDWKHIKYDTSITDALQASYTTYMECPTCAHPIQPRTRDEMSRYGCWLKDGQTINTNGEIEGDGVISKIASFWLKGPAAAFGSWQQLVRGYITVMQEFERTKDEGPVQKYYNTDFALPFVSQSRISDRLPEKLKERAAGPGESNEPSVPVGTRAIIATVDVQKNLFVVQMHGIRPGQPFDVAIFDRFEIRKSERLDEDGERAWVKPATYLDDWDLLIEKVMEKTYPLADDSGRRMSVKATFCDSGGAGQKNSEVSATSNAYHFYRRLAEKGKAARFHLVKGEGNLEAPMVVRTFPDSQQKDKFAAARGDVPILRLNSTYWKDILASRLLSTSPGSGMFTFAKWLPDWFYAELCVEVKMPSGRWENVANARNEAWDLAYYCLAGCESPGFKYSQVNWSEPPMELSDWDTNPLVLQAGQDKVFANRDAAVYDFSELGKRLN